MSSAFFPGCSQEALADEEEAGREPVLLLLGRALRSSWEPLLELLEALCRAVARVRRRPKRLQAASASPQTVRGRSR
eukprot:14215980-Alexandrium_andersonii.AAC.1